MPGPSVHINGVTVPRISRTRYRSSPSSRSIPPLLGVNGVNSYIAHLLGRFSMRGLMPVR
jgi:hypothetical protein